MKRIKLSALASRVEYATPPEIDLDARIIRGVSTVTMGEAKGHDVHLDAEFLDTVVAEGQRLGAVKCRFGHPNMCNEAMGTFVGWFTHFRRDGDRVRADLQISDTADASPKGPLGTYVLELATKEANAFGTSVVFQPGRYYRRDEDGHKIYAPGSEGAEQDAAVAASWGEYEAVGDKEFVECMKLRATDVVDEAAANEGLFGTDIYGDGAFAATLTEALDLHPQMVEWARNHPQVVDEFLDRYQHHRDLSQPPKEIPMTPDPDTLEPTPSETPEVPLCEHPQQASPEAPDRLSFAEYRRTVKEFGAAAAAAAWDEGTGHAGAQTVVLQQLREENEQLKAHPTGTTPLATGEANAAKSDTPKSIFRGRR